MQISRLHGTLHMSQIVQAKTNMFPISFSQDALGKICSYSMQTSQNVDYKASLSGLSQLLMQLGEQKQQELAEQMIVDYPQSRNHPITLFYLPTHLPDDILNKKFAFYFEIKGRKQNGHAIVKLATDFGSGVNNYEICRFINLILKDAMNGLQFFNIKQRYFDINTLKRTQTTFMNRMFDIGWLYGIKVCATQFANKISLQILPVNTRFQCKTVAQFVSESPGNERFLRNMTVMTLHNGMQYKIDRLEKGYTVNSLMNSARPEDGTFLSHFIKDEQIINQVYHKVLGITGVVNTLARDNFMIKALPLDKIKKGRIRKGCLLPPGLCVIMSDPGNSPAFGLTRDVREQNEIDPFAMYNRALSMVKVITENDNVQHVLRYYNIYINNYDDLYVFETSEPLISMNDGRALGFYEARRQIQNFEPCESLIYRAEGGRLTGGLQKWGILGGNSDANAYLAQELEKRFSSMCRVQGEFNKLSRPVIQNIRLDPNERMLERFADEYYNGMRALYDKLQCESANEVQIIVIVLPGRNKQANAELYRQIKRDAYRAYIVTQCVAECNIRKGTILGALAQQIYSKAGGSVWAPVVDEQFKDAMCCAMDISRPETVYRVKDAVQISSGFVSTYFGLEHIFSQARRVHREKQAGEVQRGREVGDYLDMALMQYYYFRYRSYLPSKIVFYRDGVADGQLRDVTTAECDQAIAMLQTRCYRVNMEIEFYFIVAQKSPALRICGAPLKPGTFLLDGDCNFYLASQTCEGTATPKPVRYCVVKHCMVGPQGATDVYTDLYALIKYTNSLAYGYVNWCSSIQTPHILHLAHHLSKFTNEVLQGYESFGEEALMGMKTRPYFI